TPPHAILPVRRSQTARTAHSRTRPAPGRAITAALAVTRQTWHRDRPLGTLDLPTCGTDHNPPRTGQPARTRPAPSAPPSRPVLVEPGRYARAERSPQ